MAPETNRDDDSPSEPTAKPRKKRFKKKSTVSLEQIQLIGGIVATLLGAGAAIWLALVLFGAAGTASEAYAQPAHYW